MAGQLPSTHPASPRRPLRPALPILLGLLAFTATYLLANEAPPVAPATQPTTSTQTRPTTQARTPEQRKADDIARVMEFFRLTQPDVYEQAKSLRNTDPAKFEKLISGAISTVNKLESTKRRNPVLFELSMQDLRLSYETLRTAHELKRTDIPPADRKLMVDNLAKNVAADFDLQQQIRQMEIDDLRKRITDLDGQVHDRQKDKDLLIQRRMEDLIERTPRLEW